MVLTVCRMVSISGYMSLEGVGIPQICMSVEGVGLPQVESKYACKKDKLEYYGKSAMLPLPSRPSIGLSSPCHLPMKIYIRACLPCLAVWKTLKISENCWPSFQNIS